MSIPNLAHRPEFDAALKDYHLSNEARQTLNETPFVLMLAPTSAGRNTIINQLLQTGHYYFIVSDTTRPPRVNNGVLEQDGVEYFFRSEPDMLDDIKAGRFVEAEVIFGQQVSGTSIREVEKAHQQGKIAITDVDLGGSLNIARLKPDVKLVFVVPPSFEEWHRRIVSRSNPTDEEIRRRLNTAVNIFETVLKDRRFICVINDDLQAAVRVVDEYALHDTIDQAAQTQARKVAQDLLAKTKEFLALQP